MNAQSMQTKRLTVALSAAALVAAAIVLACFPQVVGRPVSSALSALAGAERWWLLLAATGFVAAFGCTVAAWRAALAAAGGRIPRRQAAARLGIGAMVNSFAPAKLGDAVKVALCARVLEAESRIRTIGAAYAALAAARSLALATLVVSAAAIGAMPLWPVFALCGVVAALAVAIRYSSRVARQGTIAQVVRGLAELGRSPRALGIVVAWTLLMVTAQLAATVAVGAALGLPHPLTAAFVILPALEVASALPVTPGSIGIGSGAVAVALASRGIGTGDALGVGFAMQGLQTLVSIGAGSVGALSLVQLSPTWRRALLRSATVGASIGFAVGLGELVALVL